MSLLLLQLLQPWLCGCHCSSGSNGVSAGDDFSVKRDVEVGAEKGATTRYRTGGSVKLSKLMWADSIQ